MPTLGEELKRRREERGISLADISEETKISSRFLKAIESDNFSTLPGGIFTRSFIRAYAKEVDLDEEEAIALYHQQIGAPPPESPQQTGPLKQPAPVTEPLAHKFEPVTYRQSGRGFNWSTLIIGLAIAAFVIIILVAVIKRIERSNAENAAETPPQQVAKPAPPPEPTPTPQTGPPQAQPSDQLLIRIEAAAGDCWLRYTVDEGEASSMILKQGLSHDLPPAQNQVVLKYGNRQTIKVLVNNREINFPIDSPKFKGEVTISRSNLQTFFN